MKGRSHVDISATYTTFMDIGQSIIDQCFQYLSSKGFLERIGTSKKYNINGEKIVSTFTPHSACNMEALSLVDPVGGMNNPFCVSFTAVAKFIGQFILSNGLGTYF